MDLSPFAKIAKYLKHPLVLAGFALFLFYAFADKAVTLPILSQITGDATAGFLMALLDKGFWLALLLVAGGLGLQYVKHLIPSAKQRLEHPPAVSGDAGKLADRIADEARKHGELIGKQASAAEIAKLQETIGELHKQAAEKNAPKGLAVALAAAEQSGDTQAVEMLLSRVAEEKAANAKTAARDAARDLRRAATLARWRDTRQALAYLRRATEIDPDDARAWIERARLETQAGGTAAARDSYRRGEAAAIASGDQRLIAVTASEGGELALRLGKTADGVAELRRAHDALENLAAADPNNAAAQRDLSVSHNKIGDALMQTGDAAGALTAYRDSLGVRQKLAAADPGDAQAQRDLSVSHEKIGDALMRTGDAAGALKAYRDSLGIRQKRAAADPNDAQAQRDLSVSHNKIGDALMQTGDAAGALNAYRDSHRLLDKLAAADPSNAEAQRDLSISHNNIGDALMKTGDPAGALKAYHDSFEITSKLAAADPASAFAQRTLLVSHVKLSEVATAADEKTAHLRQALAIAQRLAAESRLAPADAWMVADLERRLAAD